MYSNILNNGSVGEADNLDAIKYLFMDAIAGNNMALLELMTDLNDDMKEEDKKEEEEQEEENDDDSDGDLLSLLQKILIFIY